MYIVLEVQANGEKVSVLPAITKATRPEAESVYHSILASAAVSAVPVHSALVLGEDGVPIMQFAYRHSGETE